jgi:hypothetical protein
MRKRVGISVIALVLALTVFGGQSLAAETAKPTSSSVQVNGQTDFYAIVDDEGNIYKRKKENVVMEYKIGADADGPYLSIPFISRSDSTYFDISLADTYRSVDDMTPMVVRPHPGM